MSSPPKFTLLWGTISIIALRSTPNWRLSDGMPSNGRRLIQLRHFWRGLKRNLAHMAVGLYADVHVPGPVIAQLRYREVDILAATEEGTNELPDDELLNVAGLLRRVASSLLRTFGSVLRPSTGSALSVLLPD
jgi:hypothetical protein